MRALRRSVRSLVKQKGSLLTRCLLKDFVMFLKRIHFKVGHSLVMATRYSAHLRNALKFFWIAFLTQVSLETGGDILKVGQLFVFDVVTADPGALRHTRSSADRAGEAECVFAVERRLKHRSKVVF